MSDLAEKLFAAIPAVTSGVKDLVPEVSAELSRLGTQGSMELASALFGNGAFVPYGPGQYTPTPAEHAPEPHVAEPVVSDEPAVSQEHTRGGIER